jgi:hypothetical protein
VIHLERGEPDFDTPPHIVEALAAAARAGETHYPDARGTLALREALVQKLERDNAVRCHPDDVVVTRAAPTRSASRSRPCSDRATSCWCCRRTGWRSRSWWRSREGASYRTLPVYLDLLSGALTPAELAIACAARSVRRRVGSISTRPTTRPARCSVASTCRRWPRC